jgi:hypothetical protein
MILAARRGDQQRADPVGKLLEGRLGAGAVAPEAGDDHRLAALLDQGGRGIDRLWPRRGGRRL